MEKDFEVQVKREKNIARVLTKFIVERLWFVVLDACMETWCVWVPIPD